MEKYRLYKGFNLIGQFNSIFDAKKKAPKEDGVYNLIGNDSYVSSWQILNGVIYN